MVNWSSIRTPGPHISATLRKHIVLLFLNHLSFVDGLILEKNIMDKMQSCLILEFVTVALIVYSYSSPKHHFK